MAEVLAGVGDLMPRHDYRCLVHGKFEVTLPIGGDVPRMQRCHHREDLGGGEVVLCGLNSLWVPPTVNFPGGPTTGAKPPSLPEE